MNLKQSTALVAGSFDPMTLGHLDIIKRAAKIFDKIYVGVAHNRQKSNALLTDTQKVAHIHAVLTTINLECDFEVVFIEGLTVDFMTQHKIHTLVRGVRDVSDFTYESRMCRTNARISDENIETIFLHTSEQYAHISSSLVREIIDMSCTWGSSLAGANLKLANFIPLPHMVIDFISKAGK